MKVETLNETTTDEEETAWSFPCDGCGRRVSVCAGEDELPPEEWRYCLACERQQRDEARARQRAMRDDVDCPV